MKFPFLFRRRVIELSPAIWAGLRGRIPVLAHLDAREIDRHQTLMTRFLRDTAIEGAAGFHLDDRMRLEIAALVCLPVIHLELDAYDPFSEVIVYPTVFETRREEVDEEGLVHAMEGPLAGEALDGGPIVLAWDEVEAGRAGSPLQVVLHECAHKLDLADGLADGCPPLSGQSRPHWQHTLDQVLYSLRNQVDTIESALPAHIDPESCDADPWYETLPLDPYAATDAAECFAVSIEAFFSRPHQLRQNLPEWYACLARYLGQDPAESRFRSAGTH